MVHGLMPRRAASLWLHRPRALGLVGEALVVVAAVAVLDTRADRKPPGLAAPGPQSPPSRRLQSGDGGGGDPAGPPASPCSTEVDTLPTSLSSIYLAGLEGWLRDSPFQAVLATLALLAGILCLWDGDRFFQKLLTCACMAAAASAAGHEAKTFDFDAASQVLFMVQAAFTTAVAMVLGFEGFVVLFGTLLGFFSACSCGYWARRADNYVPGVVLLWYSIGAAFGLFVFTRWRKPVLATMAPLLGGFLAVTGVGTLGSHACMFIFGGRLPILPGPGEPWIDAASALLSPTGHGALAAHSGCAMFAAVLHAGSDERRLPAVLCLTGGLVVAVIAAVAGFGLESPADSQGWPVFGCVCWAVVAAVTAWQQLGKVQEHDAIDLLKNDPEGGGCMGNLSRGGSFAAEGGGCMGNLRRASSGSFAAAAAAASSAGGGCLGGFHTVRSIPGACAGGGCAGGLLRARQASEDDWGTEDSPGIYTITHDSTLASYTIKCPTAEEDVIERLGRGEKVMVMEVVQDRDQERVRARIEHPSGWISLKNLETGYRWAERAAAR